MWCLTFDNNPMAQVICLFNFIFCPLIQKFRHFVIFLFLGLKIIISVLLTFSESLFAWIHSYASLKSLLICLLTFFRSNCRGDFYHLQSALWFTESKAFCKSRNTLQEFFSLSFVNLIFSVSYNRAWVVECMSGWMVISKSKLFFM